MMASLAAVHPQVASRQTTCTLISDARAFAGLRPDWNDLLLASRSPAPFLTWEWLHPWWTHLRGKAALHVLAIRTGGRLIAVAPVMATSRGLSLSSRLELLGTGPAGADYLDLIVRAGHEPAAVEAIAGAIVDARLPVRFDHLPPASIAGRLGDELRRAGWTAIASAPDVCPFIDLEGHTWESYVASLGASHRANFRRRLRSLEGRFEVRFGAAESDEDRDHALQALVRFHEQRFKGRGSTAFSTPALRAFHGEVTRAMHDAGWLRLYVLSLNAEPVAVMYGFGFAKRFYFYQHGFSEAHSSDGIGLVLMGLTIRAAIEDGATEFDMLYGHEAYKFLWARSQRALGRLELFPPHLAGRLLRRQVSTRRALRDLARRVGLKGSHARV